MLAVVTLNTTEAVAIILGTAGTIGAGIYRAVAPKLRARNSKESSIEDTIKAMFGEQPTRTRPLGTTGVFELVEKQQQSLEALQRGFPALKLAVDEIVAWQKEHDARVAREKRTG